MSLFHRGMSSVKGEQSLLLDIHRGLENNCEALGSVSSMSHTKNTAGSLLPGGGSKCALFFLPQGMMKKERIR